MSAPVSAWVRSLRDRRRVVTSAAGKHSGRYDLRFDDGQNNPVETKKVEPSLSDGSALSGAAKRAREAQLARIRSKK